MSKKETSKPQTIDEILDCIEESDEELIVNVKISQILNHCCT